MSPLISVVVPSYMHGHLIGRALKSLQDQSYTNWEAIIVDNYSDDQTDLAIKNFADERIRVLKVRNKGIIAASRNAGVREARGEWIAFLDSDDYWMADKLKECIESARENIDLIYHGMKIEYAHHKWFARRNLNVRALSASPFIDLLVNGNIIPNSSVLVRAQVLKEIGGINESKNIVACEDYHTWLRMAKLEKNFFYLPRTLGYYYHHNNGVSKKNMAASTWATISEFLHLLDSMQLKKVTKQITYSEARYYFLNKNYVEAQRCLKDIKVLDNLLLWAKAKLMLSYVRAFNWYSKLIKAV